MITPNVTSPTNIPVGHATGGSASDPPTDDMFLKLLVSQLKNQSPIDPMDPNQFTSQLVEFNMLNQLTQIRSLLQSQANHGQPPATPANSNQGGL